MSTYLVMRVELPAVAMVAAPETDGGGRWSWTGPREQLLLAACGRLPRVPTLAWIGLGTMYRLQGRAPHATIVAWGADGSIVHRLSIFPTHFRFPFMGPEDSNVGGVYTDPDARGRGLATEGIARALGRLSHDRPGTCAWYVVDETNTVSIAAARRNGFEVVGWADRVRPRGALPLAAYVMRPEE